MYRLINIVGTAKNFFAPDRTISLNKKCIPLYPYIKSIFLKMPCKQIHLPIYLLDRISYRFGKSVAIRIGFAFYPSIIICLAIDCARVVFHFNDENSILVYDDIIKLSFSPIIRNTNCSFRRSHLMSADIHSVPKWQEREWTQRNCNILWGIRI